MPRISSNPFTTYSDQLVNVLVNDVRVGAHNAAPADARTYKAIWDTGATRTTVAPRVVTECGLVPTGMVNLTGIHGTEPAPTFLVNLQLPNNVQATVRVAQAGQILGGDILIGMDIIGAGDFAISSWQGKTTFTYRFPSQGRIDFLPPGHRLNDLRQARAVAVGRNAPCPCGSGKKYKRCCGAEW